MIAFVVEILRIIQLARSLSVRTPTILSFAPHRMCSSERVGDEKAIIIHANNLLIFGKSQFNI